MAAIALGCSSAPSPAPGSTPTGQPSPGLASDALVEPSTQDSPGAWQFAGTSDSVVAEVTDAGLSCDQARPVMGFEVRDCGRDSGGSRAFVGVYARANGDLAGVDMTLVSANPTDPDTLVSFVALGLGGAMGPDTFDAVSEQVSSRLDGSSPNPVWVSADLRLTVRVSGNSTFVTVLAADLAAAWGS